MNPNKFLITLALCIGGILLTNPASADHGGFDRWAPVLARVACKSVHRFRHCGLIGTQRDTPAEGIHRTRYHLRVGPGEYDRIIVHRVATDDAGRRTKNLMLLPGTGLDVDNLYLPGLNSNEVPDDFSPLIQMARSGIDAWSADYRGSNLPTDIVDYSFMSDWCLETAVTDMQLAIRFARLVRLFSGDGYRKITVGGYSAGVTVAFSIASADAARHYGRRDVGGIVAIDDAFETDPATSGDACDSLEFVESEIAAGVLSEDQTFIIDLAQAAKSAPDEMSVFGPTTLQFFNILTVLPSAGTFHIFGGTFDEDGFPFPTFTPQAFVLDQASLLEPVLPIRISRDILEIRCRAEPASSFDGGIAGIRVPVLHIGAAGGNANAIDYTLSQISSTDVTSTLVRVGEVGQEAFDYGHGDVFAATDADIRVWQAMIDWVNTH